jgi:hypothetical protein
MIGEFIIVHPYAVDCVHWVDELWVREAHPRRDMLWKRLLTCLHVVTLKKKHIEFLTGWWFWNIFYGMSSFPLTSIFFKMVKTCYNHQPVKLP